MLRESAEDFRVEEILVDGSKAQIVPPTPPQISKRGRYLVCVLVKRNLDTLLAVRAVANEFGIDQERIQIAGIKDKRALTAQHISIGRFLPEQAQLKLDKLWLYPSRFSDEKIHTGLLFGNQFNIVVRAIRHTSSQTIRRLKKVHTELLEFGGCPNFYGHQRFGTTRPITHLIGKHILLGEWEKGALAFLAKPSPSERHDSREARERLWRTQNYREALKQFPPGLVYEREMLVHLAKRPKDFLGAFHRLPKKLLQLFVQGYQSYLFNRFLSERIRRKLPLKEARNDECIVRNDEENYLALPQIGYMTCGSAGEQGQIEKRILEEEGILPHDFKVSAMPEISLVGGLRNALIEVIGLSCTDPLKNDSNSRGLMLQLSFSLRKGSYATVLLREFMKSRDPVEAGF
jgi:tRNA pseudouridine13 synthase